MVQVITARLADHVNYGGGQPIIHVHHVARDVHGNGIALRVYGEVRMAAKEVIFAREMKLNTIQVLLLTIEQGTHYGFFPSKWIYHKGEYDNYASVDIFCVSAGEMLAGGREDAVECPDALPEDGSIWLNFMALGE